MNNMPTVPVAWPITSDLLESELAILLQIAGRWHERFSNEEFLQMLDSLPEVERLELFAQFANELKVVATKSASLVEVLL